MDPNSAVSPNQTIVSARNLAQRVLARRPEQALPVLHVAELCRQTGALAEARALLEHLMTLGNPPCGATLLDEAFKGRPEPNSVSGNRPARFVRRLNFLPGSLHQVLFDGLCEALPRFQASRVDTDPAADNSYAKAQRSSLVLYKPGILGKRFLEPMTQLLEAEIYPLFGIDRQNVTQIELQATCHGDGAFFTAHTDSDLAQTNTRQISFVYYLHRQPRAFTGGDLILFDADPEAKSYSRTAYTRVDPVDNSLIVFPSAAVHEVQKISLPKGDDRDGRLTINGWVRVGRR